MKQNASEVVSRAARGESVTITDRGRAVAKMVPLHVDWLEALQAEGRATTVPADWVWADLSTSLTPPSSSPTLSEILQEMRDEEYR